MSSIKQITDYTIGTHPGEILAEMFLQPMDITAYRLAKETNIPQTRVSEIIHGRRAITADTAIRLSRFFGNTAEYWMNLQAQYDIEEAQRSKAMEYNQINRYKD